MPDGKYAIVMVTVQNGKVVCDPDWVYLHCKRGPTDIKWKFKGMPDEAAGAVVEFLTEPSARYAPRAAGPGQFQPRGVHRGFGRLPGSEGSRVPDLFTEGNIRVAGYFHYEVRLLNAAGEVIGQADPGGDNDPETGPNP
jgi:hypothetical protein